MTAASLIEITLLIVLVGLLTRPLGGYLTRVYAGESIVLRPIFGPLEKALYRFARVDRSAEQSWYRYAASFLVFHVISVAMLYGILRLQALWPLNLQHLPAPAADLALNTAVSFVTNTSWQSYAGETTLSYAAQMTGITVHSFLSAASGLAVAVVLIRGFARRQSSAVGNFWVDLARGVLYVLLPICVAAALILVAAGVPQTLAPAVDATTLEGGASTDRSRSRRDPRGDQAVER
jgi:potassium-transporting ATPase potassium-binding subunit